MLLIKSGLELAVNRNPQMTTNKTAIFKSGFSLPCATPIRRLPAEIGSRSRQCRAFPACHLRKFLQLTSNSVQRRRASGSN